VSSHKPLTFVFKAKGSFRVVYVYSEAFLCRGGEEGNQADCDNRLQG